MFSREKPGQYPGEMFTFQLFTFILQNGIIYGSIPKEADKCATILKN